MSSAAGTRTKDLRVKKLKELQVTLGEQKKELASLRVTQAVTGRQGTSTKLGKVKAVRKSIARVLTVINQKARESFAKQMQGEAHKPKQLRAKKTRAIRRRLTPEQAGKKTLKEKKRADNFPVLKYAIKA